jgi:4-amino-4-deoxy-L-arabinose transferase-like glycosyltransferase
MSHADTVVTTIGEARTAGGVGRRKGELLAVTVLLCLFLALGTYYVLTQPLYSKPDEAYHYAHVLHLRAGKGLPVIDTSKAVGDFTSVELEGHQPPLYYATVAGLASVLGVEDARFPSRNPHLPWVATYVSEVGNAAVFFTGRFVSLACGVLALVFAYCLTRLFLPRPLALLSAGLMGLNPQFIFIASSLSNDMASTATVHLGLWQLGVVLQRGLSARRALRLGLIIALATLTKLTGLGLLVPLGGIALWEFGKRRSMEPLFHGALAGLTTGVVCSWWFWRNWSLYGNPFATNMLSTMLGGRTAPFTWQEGQELLSFLWKSYWLDMSPGGLIAAESFVYVALGGVCFAAAIGLIVALARRPDIRPLFLLVWGWFAILFVSFVQLTTQTPILIGGGRLLFPGAIAIGSTLAVGLTGVAAGRYLPATLLALLLGAYATLAPSLYLFPLYPRPEPTASLERPPTHVVEARYGTEPLFELVGYDLNRVQGEDTRLEFTYYWRSITETRRDFSVFLHLITDGEGELAVLEQLDTYPGLGRFPTSQWTKGTIFVDELTLPVPSDFDEGMVWTGLYHLPTGERLPVFDVDGRRIHHDAVPLTYLSRTTDGELKVRLPAGGEE